MAHARSTGRRSGGCESTSPDSVSPARRGGGAPGRRARLGKAGEDAALAHLESLGWRLLERNWRCALGEIDLIVMDEKTIVFVEVKARSSDAFGSGAEALGRAKREKLARTALTYLNQRRAEGAGARFDVLSLEVETAGGWRIDHIRNAFDLPGGW